MQKTPLIVALFALMLSTSCHKREDKPAPPLTAIPTGPYLYVGGGTTDYKGIYWKSQLVHPEPVADTVKNSGVITDMVSTNDGLYFAAQTHGYWKNDSFVAIPNASNIGYIAVSGSTVYAAGFDNYGQVTYWTGNIENDLKNTYDRTRYPEQGVTTFGVSGMTASAGNVYVTGYLSFENEPGLPDTSISGNFVLLWTDGSLQPYGPGVLLSAVYQSTKGVAVAGNDVYVAGSYPDTTYAGGYWKNGVWNSLAKGTFSPSSIATNGTSICIPGNYWVRGSYTLGAAYWLDGKLVNLNGAYALAATFFASDLYIVGVDNNSNIVVWKNGNLFETIGPSNSLVVTSIAIR